MVSVLQLIRLMEYYISVIATLIAGIVAWTGYQQHRLAKEKLKLDLFEKRFSVYKGIQAFLSQIMQEGKFDKTGLLEFYKSTQESDFLFETEISEYIKSIRSKALKMRTIQSKYENMAIGNERNQLIDKEHVIFNELANELPELTKVFKPYLKFPKWK